MTTFPTDCTRFEDDLKAYADGELSWLRRRAVRRHLTHCASCQEEIFSMTQIAEDLRTTDPADTLPPNLREKILADVPLAPVTVQTGRGTETFSADSPMIGGRGASPRKRPALAWVLSGAALIAWFVCYPMFGKVHEYARHASMLANSAPMRSPQIASDHPQYGVPLPPAASQSAQTYDRNGPAAPAIVSPSPQTFTVRLSDRDAGTDKGYINVKNPDSVYQAIDGTANALSATANADPDSLRQVHKEASIGIQVPNPETTGDTLNTMVQETGGYVAANNLSTGGDGLKSAELIVKIPVTQFEPFLAQVAKLGSVQSKNISGEDITEKTSDADQTESVLESDLQQSEARLKSLGSKAKWHDQEATRDLRIQLAQSRARLVLLKRMAALGTITIDLSQTPKAAAVPPVTNGFTGSFKTNTHDALQSLVGSAGALLAFVIWLLAYAPIWIPLLLIGRYALKEYKKRAAV